MFNVSVLMPVYNAEQYVAEAVNSILCQTLADFEFIIVDDGSTDRSLTVLRCYQQQDSRIRLMSRPNTGIVGALNDGLAHCRGEFVARMDADDLCAPERLQSQYDYLRSQPQCVAVGTRCELIDPQGDSLRTPAVPLSHQDIDAHNLGGTGSALCHPTVMMRRSVITALGGYRTGYPCAEDVDLFLRLAEVGTLANLPMVGLRYRMHTESVGNTKRVEQVVSARRAVEDARARRGMQPARWADEVPSDCTLSHTFLRWGWWALNSGHVATARRYAVKSVRTDPSSLGSWKLLACAVRGH